MKVKRELDNPVFTLIDVQPWPDERFASYVTVVQEKRDTETGAACNRVAVRFGQHPATIETAREWAQAILKACDIAERLEKEGGIILEGEEGAECGECGTRHAPGQNTLCAS